MDRSNLSYLLDKKVQLKISTILKLLNELELK